MVTKIVRLTRDRIEVTVPAELAEHITPELQAKIAAYYREMIDREMARLIYGRVPVREPTILTVEKYVEMFPDGNRAGKSYWPGIINADGIT